jgi:hypothetical protein
MKIRKSVSKESLQRLWSEIALLRQEVEQAERDQSVPQMELPPAIEVTRARLTSSLD